MRTGVKVGPPPPPPLSPEVEDQIARWRSAGLEWSGVFWEKYYNLGPTCYWTKQEREAYMADRLAIALKYGLVSRSEHAPTG